MTIMPFHDFYKKFLAHFNSMTKNAIALYRVNFDPDELWNLYLDSFPAGTNPVYRVRREFDCSCCRHFIKTLGGVVAINGNEIETIWDFDTTSPECYQPVVDALSAYVKSKPIKDVFLTHEPTVGTARSYERDENGNKVLTWNHFFVNTPRCAYTTGDINAETACVRDDHTVFLRSMSELTLDATQTVLELIAQNSLYRGAEWKSQLEQLASYQEKYNAMTAEQKELQSWVDVIKMNPALARIRNTSIGTLLIDLSEGKDVNTAVTAYERVVAPANYKRPKAIFTKRMLDDAKKTVTELGYLDSLPRRFARLDDISVNNILFANRDAVSRMNGAATDPFAAMEQQVAIDPKRFSHVEEIGIDKFISDVLPIAKELELFMENRFSKNMVSLTAPVNPDAKTMFKWDNAFAWAYTGNLADSDIRENVKRAGGKVDGVLRFSIQWNDEPGKWDKSDEDAHCKGPCGHIWFSKKRSFADGGNLDVDIIHPNYGEPAVENITWPNLSRMKDGQYEFYVHCYRCDSGNNGFIAEIEANGEVHQYEYRHPIFTSANVPVATVTLKDGKFTIKDKLKSNISSRNIWNIGTNQFVPVNVAMYSPNYWDEQSGIGNRHYFFMLKGCQNPDKLNGFYNEFIKQELLTHKRVFEALGSQMSVQPVEDQLSGVGFSSTRHDSFVVKVKGQTERVLKVVI